MRSRTDHTRSSARYFNAVLVLLTSPITIVAERFVPLLSSHACSREESFDGYHWLLSGWKPLICLLF